MLNKWTSGDKAVESELIEQLYPVIHQIARIQLKKNRDKNYFETTEIVHEAFIKLQNQNQITWQNRNQFYAISAQIIRRLLIDEYRKRSSKKRSTLEPEITLDKMSSIIIGEVDVDFDLLEFDKLLKELETLDATAAQVVELRFYGGYTQKEIAEICKISVNLVNNNWSFARSWLLSQLKTA